MRAIRRVLQVVALVGTLLVGIVAVALIVSQTPWFKDWLRRYIVRESKQYVNGQLTIGGLGGNLLFGVDLSDVAVDLSGERVVAVKGLELNYSVFELISKGIVLDQIKIDKPVLRLERTANGWNVADIVKRRRQEADRQGPGRPVSLPSIQISDATVSIHDRRATADGYTLPARIEGFDVQAGFAYEPVHYSLTLDHVSFRSSAPTLALQQLSGKLSVRDDNLYVDRLSLTLADSSMTVDGVVEHYLQTPVVKVTTTGTVSLPEIGRVVPAASGYGLHPTFTIKANGPADRLGLDLDVRSEAGNVSGTMTADVKAPDLGVRGNVNVERLNLAPILKDPAQKTDLTGQARVDIRLASAPAPARVNERLTGTFAFKGPHVAAAGYEARDVNVTGRLDGPRISLDGHAAAYGGSATASGEIVTPAPGRPLSFDLRGKAAGVDLRNLPASTGAPRLATDLSVSEYHVAGRGPAVSGSATLENSTVEGAKIARGTVAQFNVDGANIGYSARGDVTDLDLQRVGRGLKVDALDKPEYESRISGTFDVTGSVPRGVTGHETALGSMTLDANGTLRDSDVMGGRIPTMQFDTHLADGALAAKLDGGFEGFNPAKIAQKPQLDGTVSGTINATASVADVTAPITPDAITADGTLSLTRSNVGGLEIDSATVDGHYADQSGDVRQLNVVGPDLKVEASGHLSMDRSGRSNLQYHVDAVDVAKLGRLAGQDGLAGAATVDGTLTGNAAHLQTSGTLKGSNLSYQKNNALGLNTQYTVSVPDLKFANARVQATTDATFVEAGGMKLNAVKATTTYAGRTIDFTTNLREEKRELDAAGQLILHPDHQEVHLPHLSIRTQGVEWTTPPDSQAAIEYGGGRITLNDVRLVSADQSLAMTGTIATGDASPTGEARAEGLKVNAQNIDLQQLQTMLLQDRGLAGRLTADATVSGSTGAPAIDGHVEIRQGSFRAYKFDSFTATANYTGTRVDVDATLQQSPTESITAKGTVPTSLFQHTEEAGHVPAHGEDRVDLHITSTEIGLGVIQGVTDLVTNVTGTVQADVHVLGSGEDPHLQGYIDIKNGGLGAPDLGETYSGLTTRVDLQPDLVKIQGFQVKDRHGESLSVQGQLAVHQRSVGAVDVSIDSDNFELLHNELGDVQVQSSLKVTGEVRRPRIVGDVRVDAGRIEADRLLEHLYDPYSVNAIPDVESADRKVQQGGSAEDATKEALAQAKQSVATPSQQQAAAGNQPATPSGGFAPVALDIHLVVPDNLVIRGKNIRPGGPSGMSVGNVNVTLGGDIRARKEPDGPVVLVGDVSTVRGTYDFQGRRFDLVRGGTLRFVGDPEFNPTLDVSATRQIPNTGVEARVHITGTARAPELALSSTPPLEESDILALIVFNRPVNELGSGERSSLAATAGGIATGFIAQPLGESIGRALDLDLFEISTSTDNGALGASVTLGQQIGDRAFVKLEQGFGDRNTSVFMLEYQLAKFLRLQASVAPETTGAANRINQRRVERGGIDLIFFFSY